MDAVTGCKPPAANPKLLRSFIRALMPELPELPSDRRDRVETQVAEFVGEQIKAMPAFLGWPYRRCLALFNWSALLPYGRRYTALDLVRQRDYLRVWADSPFGPMRDFVKLIRSCTLLQYLDHPLVSANLQAGVNAGGKEP